MKKLLVALLLLPAYTSIAGFQIRLGAGPSFNTAPSIAKGDYQKLTTNYDVSLKIVYQFLKRYEVGIGGDLLQISALEKQRNIKNYLFDPGVPVYAFANRLHHLPRTVLYYGLSAGYMFEINSMVEKEYRDKGFTGGLQAGITFLIAKNFGINLEAGARYARLNYKTVGIDYGYGMEYTIKRYELFYFPATVGLSIGL